MAVAEVRLLGRSRRSTGEEEDRHLSRTPLVIDQQGWDEVSKLLSETLDRVFEIQSEASERLTKSGEKSMLSKVELLHFRSPDPV